MRLLSSLAPSLLLVATGACASGASSAAGTPPSPSPSASVDRSEIRWSGSLRPTQTRTEAAMVPTEFTKAFGTVELTASATSPRRTHARITLSAPVPSATELRWAVLPGRCGSSTLPLAAVETFPVIEMGSNGRGQVDGEIPIALPTEGQYHVNVYWQGQQLSDVLTCGNLRIGPAK